MVKKYNYIYKLFLIINFKKEMCKCIVDFIKFLKFIADILTFAFTIRLTTLSSKDPFKSHVIGNLSNYFKFYPNTTANIETMCVCNNVTYEHSCLKENILDGCLNNLLILSNSNHCY